MSEGNGFHRNRIPNYPPFGLRRGLFEQNPYQNNPYFPYLDTTLHPIVNVGEDWKKQPDPNDDPITSEQLSHLQSHRIRNVEIGHILGQGIQGQVCEILAEFNVNIETGEQPDNWQLMRFALKIICHASSDPKEIDNNLTEVRILCRLRHENIANMCEFFGIPDSITGFPFSRICMISELCDNTLEHMLKAQECYPNGVLPENLSRHWFAQVIKGLNYLHTNNTVHRDIKASNILYRWGNVDRSGRFIDRFLSCTFKIADFGLSEMGRMSILGMDIFDVVNTLEESTDIQPDGLLDKLINDVRFGSQFQFQTIHLLLHPWLQANNEPRTEQYILRQDLEINVQPEYDEWEDYRLKEDPNYAPFGLGDGQRQSTMPYNDWRVQQLPIKGCTPKPD